MDPSILAQLIKNEIEQIASVRASEQQTRDAISSRGLDVIITELFPGVDSEFVKSNADLSNELRAGVGRYGTALARGEWSWEWSGEGDAPEEGTPQALLAPIARDLIRDGCTDSLSSGKFAFFTYRDDRGVISISALTGFLWPIFKDGDSNIVEALVQVITLKRASGVKFEVRRYTPGLLEVFTELDDWTKFATAAKTDYPQPHARDHLPVAFRIVARDANRQPEGLAQVAMSAFRAYVKATVMKNFIAETGGFEERVVKSNQLFDLAQNNPKHPMLANLKKVGPRQLRLVETDGTYERLDPVPLSDYRENARDAKEGVLSALNIPSTDGANLTGIALQEKREAYTETVSALAASIADALTEAVTLAAALDPRLVRPGWRVTLMPRFTQDVQTERTFVVEAYSKGALPKSAALSGLQSLGVTYITDDMIQRAKDAEESDTLPDLTLPAGVPPPAGDA
ncbi:hypothetical protein [Deinococcus peraridilitoris]|uniref:Phage portal protein, SPP1 Gp6 n=1 Tax=Deinococcus peraridilitoris (strain DSM 19664 / LMG 22246 / CIP 109416 / KR-200) TaxID=937777 RepID=K9ZWQ1_DEIPD|nr:hypothetical protein [Deinococcus peraridilitoris]AFZ66078.1 hypothetical protein Deipe_0482 [Deinococcus peraridilitoris DSM 19664]